MDKMIELINSINALTKAVAALTDKITTEYLNAFETIYDPQKDEPQAEAPKEQQTVTFVQLRSRLSEISRAGHTAEVKALISQHGAEKLSDLAETEYAAVLKEAEDLV